ncbi:MAG: LysR family transcriptional regulator [Paracoccaceae bacterium]
MNKLPPLNAMHAFARVAETGSFAEAAKVLNVTPAAVSQQVRRLEQFFDTRLLQKHGRGVLLTDDGQILSRATLNGLAQIEQGAAQISNRTSSAAVRVTTSPSFATHWLVPRISKFQMDHPDIAIQLDLSAEARTPERSDFDLAIRYCKWEDLPTGADLLKSVTLNVLCPTELLPPKPISPKALAQLPWLQELGVSEIKGWFYRRGFGQDLPHRISEMPGNLIMEALVRGEAVAYVVCDWMEAEIRSGALHELWPKRERGAYYMQTKLTGQNEATAIFLNWLKAEIT